MPNHGGIRPLRLLPLILVVAACGAHPVNYGERSPVLHPAPDRTPSRADYIARAKARASSPENQLRYWQYGCPKDAPVRNVEVLDQGQNEKELRRSSMLTRWEVVCGAKVLRCSQRRLLRCAWGPPEA